MGNVIELFTSFSGRINRASWWLGFVTLAVLNIAVMLVLQPEIFSLKPDAVRSPNLAVTIWGLFLLFPMTAITVKRFNDRDWPNWLGYAYGLMGLVNGIAQYFGFLASPDRSMTDAIAFFIFALVGLFILIVNGFLRGTPGPNRYGPDPLQSI